MGNRSSLLIVCTGWIFTLTGTTGYSEFPAYSQISSATKHTLSRIVFVFITVFIILDGVIQNIGKPTALCDGVYLITVYCLTTF